MITTLLIDLWQTLATKKMRIFERIQQEYALSDDAFPFFKDLMLRMEVAEIDEDGFWLSLYSEYAIDPAKPRLKWIDIYHEITVINQDLMHFADEFKLNGGSVVLFSNTDPAAKQYLDAKNVTQLFTKTFFSFDARLLKPRPELIEYVLNELSVSPGEILYIDDNPDCIETAKRYGINGIVYVDFPDFINKVERYHLMSRQVL